MTKLRSKKVLSFVILIFVVILIFLAANSLDSRDNDSKENIIENIEFQERNGNVARTKLYTVSLSNGSKLRYTKTIPGPGMLCNTNNPREGCETEIKPGYTEINSAISSSEYRKQEEDFSTYYYPENMECATRITEGNIKISGCS